MPFNWRFWQSDKDRLTERAIEESRLSPLERDIDQEDFEARKDDIEARRDFLPAEDLDG